MTPFLKTIIGSDIKEAKRWLDRDEIVAIPTETVYGLAANALSVDAIAKIYEVKNRPIFNPLIIHVGRKDEIIHYVRDIPIRIQHVIDAFMPGPLTVLLEKSDRVPDLVTAGSPKVAIRIPEHPMAQDLLNSLDYPLAAPSANISGYVSPTRPDHVLSCLHGKIHYILDGGPCAIGIESTIIGYDEENDMLVVHRLGGLDVDTICEASTGPMRYDFSHAKPKTPGQLKSHYATQTPLYAGDIEEMLEDFTQKKIVIINFSAEKKTSVFKQYILSPSGTTVHAAQNLFGILRTADRDDADVILCEWAPESGLGKAINDRLSRAMYINKAPV